ncbi:MAG: portal protein [Pseudomonadales bacterium]
MDAAAIKYPEDEPVDDLALTRDEYAELMREIEEQPHWRTTADKEMDYADGNQLDSELLQRQRELGIPPAVEDLVGPALLSIQGYEATIRTDWRVTPNGGTGGQDVADALNYQLNQAERESHADSACSDAFRPQIAIGLGWVEVKRESDPFKFPYRCVEVNRREIHWDFAAVEKDLSDARWLRRQRWLTPDRIALVFPQHKDLVKAIGKNGPSWWAEQAIELSDGGSSTGLNNAWAEARGWTVQEERWYNPTSKEVCLAEVWYRRWVSVPVIKTPDGRVVEYDENNDKHNLAVASGAAQYSVAVVARMRRSYWLGPHCLHDGPSPYSHTHFPYVPFWGFREDATKVPYGYVRGMIYPQDALNSGISKLRWGMAVVRTERTKGAVAMTDAQFRRQVGRVDADIVLDADHMSKPGARFAVSRDFQLNAQHFQLINDSRSSIQRVSAVTSGFMGKEGTARSGLQEQTQVEQSNQSLARIMDNFRAGRSMVGELLLSMIVEDLGDKEKTIIIEGDAVREDRTVVINKPEQDAAGFTYLSNDLQRTRLKVALEDVPSTASYRGQQLNAMSEAVKSLPQQYQAAMLPFMVSLMDVPFKRDVVEAIRAAGEQETPEAIEKRIQQAVQDALAKSGAELKLRELAMKEGKTEAEIEKIRREAVQIGVQAAYSAMQAGAQVAQMPMIAPIADEIMKGAGYQHQTGDDPNFPVAAQTAAMNIKSPYIQGADVVQNTSPAFPPVAQEGASPMEGIETPTPTDNLG